MSPGADLIDIALLRERLRGTQLANDPTDVVLPPDSDRWPSDLRAQLLQRLKPAGVLMPVFEREHGLSLLFTERSAELKAHAGQISFPGGRMEEQDADIEATALRETYEEVGIHPRHISIAGYLDAMPTVTGYAITPVVGIVDHVAELKLDRTEVELAFEVPLEFLMDTRNARRFERQYMGRTIPTIEYHYEGHRIWGATAHILLEFRKVILKQ
ncbi:MAG: CoA pyrophosphatase [Woeseiaceae bacterium]|nr:CoA pyrophosphatase [Woeseiaceae bacterium]